MWCTVPSYFVLPGILTHDELNRAWHDHLKENSAACRGLLCRRCLFIPLSFIIFIWRIKINSLKQLEKIFQWSLHMYVLSPSATYCGADWGLCFQHIQHLYSEGNPGLLQPFLPSLLSLHFFCGNILKFTWHFSIFQDKISVIFS